MYLLLFPPRRRTRTDDLDSPTDVSARALVGLGLVWVKTSETRHARRVSALSGLGERDARDRVGQPARASEQAVQCSVGVGGEGRGREWMKGRDSDGMDVEAGAAGGRSDGRTDGRTTREKGRTPPERERASERARERESREDGRRGRRRQGRRVVVVGRLRYGCSEGNR